MSTEENENTRIRNILRENYGKVASSIDPDEGIGDILFQDKIITMKQLQSIRSYDCPRKRADHLLKILFETANPKTFISFREALRAKVEYDWILAFIDIEPNKETVPKDRTHNYYTEREPIVKDTNTIPTPTTPRFQKQLSTSTFLKGITSSNTELYIVETNSPYIYVYDIDTLDHRRKIKVEKLVDGWDIVAHANVLYVSERNAKLIHRIQLSDEIITNWTVNSKSLTMSINKRGNVVVSCWDLNKIIEYTTTGSSVRAIQVNALDIYIAGLKHAIQLDDDRFLICSTTTYHRVCIIDSNGRMMKSYGGREGSEIGQMNGPSYLSVDRNGFILVADFNNNRIIQLNSSLEFMREIIPGSVGLKTPLRMHLHEETRRLYIAEFNGKHITITDL